MAAKTFDVERVRQNWDRVAGSPRVALPERFAKVATPRDPYPEAERILERIRHLSRVEFSKHDRNLAPFLNEASALLDRLRAGGGAAVEATAEPAVADPAVVDSAVADSAVVDKAALRVELLKVLDDLQDLFEVYAGIGLK